MQTGTECVAAVRVELEIGGSPPRGVAIRVGARRQPFWGWLELMQVLQNVIPEELSPNLEAGSPSGQISAFTPSGRNVQQTHASDVDRARQPAKRRWT